MSPDIWESFFLGAARRRGRPRRPPLRRGLDQRRRRSSPSAALADRALLALLILHRRSVIFGSLMLMPQPVDARRSAPRSSSSAILAIVAGTRLERPRPQRLPTRNTAGTTVLQHRRLRDRDAALPDRRRRSLLAGNAAGLYWLAVGMLPLLRQGGERRLGAPRRDQPMILFPAIDLKDGACVRLERGDMARATVFNDDPAEQARALRRGRASSGCTSSTSTAPSPAAR